MRIGGGFVGPDDGCEDVWDIFMPMLFMIGIWKCHLDTWLCPRIILMYHLCVLVEAMWVQMRALEMFGSLMTVLFMVGVWKCHLDTWLCPRILLTYHICGLVEAKEV